MPTQMVESWDFLRLIQLIMTASVPFIVAWFVYNANERRRAIDEKFVARDDYIGSKLSNIERQVSDTRQELRESRQEMREGRKECSDDVRAIAAQMSEYPRRREFQETIAEIWRTMRSRHGSE
jgi:chromosome condensin MukBEF ATPase and DNA-binding subunit MukB